VVVELGLVVEACFAEVVALELVVVVDLVCFAVDYYFFYLVIQVEKHSF
jgi:hypothetical protein